MAHAADITLLTMCFICGIWLAMLPLGLAIFVNVRAWHRTDHTLSNFERFNQTIQSTFWELMLLCVLLFVLRKIMISAMNYYDEKERK